MPKKKKAPGERIKTFKDLGKPKQERLRTVVRNRIWQICYDTHREPNDEEYKGILPETAEIMQTMKITHPEEEAAGLIERMGPKTAAAALKEFNKREGFINRNVQIEDPEMIARREWLLAYPGTDKDGAMLVNAYRKKYHLGYIDNIEELKSLGFTFPGDVVERQYGKAEARLENIRWKERTQQARKNYTCGKKGKRKKHVDEFEEYDDWSDSTFAFIAGYTSGGAPYGITWEEMEKIEAEDAARDAFKALDWRDEPEDLSGSDWDGEPYWDSDPDWDNEPDWTQIPNMADNAPPYDMLPDSRSPEWNDTSDDELPF